MIGDYYETVFYLAVERQEIYMKLNKLNKHADGRYDLAEVPDKINEIIDFLNSSFITQDHDCVVIGELTSTFTDEDFKMADSHCTVATNATEHISTLVKPKSLYNNIKCPHCGESYFTVGASTSTCVYYPPIFKDGVNINPDRNTVTTTYHCMACNKDWTESN